MDHISPGSSVHGILQAWIPEWVAMPSSWGSFWSRDQTHISYISCTGRQVFISFYLFLFFTTSTICEAQLISRGNEWSC